MTSHPSAITPEQRSAARIVGYLYVIQMAVAVFGESFVRGRLVVADAAKTAENIAASERLFRLSIAGDLFVYAGVLVLTWGLYVVLRPVNRNLALLAAFFRVVETAVLCAATVNSLVMLKLLSGSQDLKAFEAGQKQSWVKLAYSTQGYGMSVGFILLGLGSTLFAYLFWKSRYVPGGLALLGIVGSLLLSVVTWATIVFPGLRVLGLSYMMPLGLYEVGLGFWLIFKGLRAPAGAPA
jgi:hypothetical protein